MAIIAITSTVDAQIKPNSPLFAMHVEHTCHATLQIVQRDMKVKEVKRYKAADHYLINFGDSVWRTYSPIKGEQMLSYEGKYFYSLTRQALVMPAPSVAKHKVKKVSSQRSPEERYQRQQMVAQTLGQLASVVEQRF